MTKYQEHRLKMFRAVIVLFSANPLLWADLDVIKAQIASLTSTVTLLSGAEPPSTIKTKGSTADKNKALMELIVLGFNGSINLYDLASSLGDTELAVNSTFTEVTFKKGGEEKIIARSSVILENLRTLEADPKAAGCGVTILKNDALEAAIIALKPKEQKQKTTADSGIFQTESVGKYYKAATGVLQKLDRSMFSNLKQTEPDFYNAFKIARRVTRPAVLNKRVPPVPPVVK